MDEVQSAEAESRQTEVLWCASMRRRHQIPTGPVHIADTAVIRSGVRRPWPWSLHRLLRHLERARGCHRQSLLCGTPDDTQRVALPTSTTGNSNVVIQTGSTYLTTWQISLQIRRQTWGFRPERARRKCQHWLSSIERQPEIAIWPPKPEIVIPLELQHIASKFQRQVRHFRPRRTQLKCHQVTTTMTDNRKWQCGPQTGNTYISRTMTDRMTITTANLEFSTTRSSKKLTPGDFNNDRQPEIAI